MPQRPLGEVEDAQGQQNNREQRCAVGNDPLVAHLAPRLARVSNAGAGVLNEGLDQVACFRRLRFRQAAVASHALPHLPPHGRIVAGLHLHAFAVGLLGIAGLGARVGPGPRPLLAEVQRQGWFVPLFHHWLELESRVGVHGVRMTALGWFDFRSAWLKPEQGMAAPESGGGSHPDAGTLES